MDRRKFLKNTGWSFLGLAASGSLLGACAPGSKDAKKIMPSASDLKMYWGDYITTVTSHTDTAICATLLKQQKDNWILSASLPMPCGRIFPERTILV